MTTIVRDLQADTLLVVGSSLLAVSYFAEQALTDGRWKLKSLTFDVPYHITDLV